MFSRQRARVRVGAQNLGHSFMSFFRVGQSQRCSTFTRSLTMLYNLLSLYTFRQEVDSFSAKHCSLTQKQLK